jgi:hypothetical protein
VEQDWHHKTAPDREFYRIHRRRHQNKTAITKSLQMFFLCFLQWLAESKSRGQPH